MFSAGDILRPTSEKVCREDAVLRELNITPQDLFTVMEVDKSRNQMRLFRIGHGEAIPVDDAEKYPWYADWPGWEKVR